MTLEGVLIKTEPDSSEQPVVKEERDSDWGTAEVKLENDLIQSECNDEAHAQDYFPIDTEQHSLHGDVKPADFNGKCLEITPSKIVKSEQKFIDTGCSTPDANFVEHETMKVEVLESNADGTRSNIELTTTVFDSRENQSSPLKTKDTCIVSGTNHFLFVDVEEHTPHLEVKPENCLEKCPKTFPIEIAKLEGNSTFRQFAKNEAIDVEVAAEKIGRTQTEMEDVFADVQQCNSNEDSKLGSDLQKCPKSLVQGFLGVGSLTCRKDLLKDKTAEGETEDKDNVKTAYLRISLREEPTVHRRKRKLSFIIRAEDTLIDPGTSCPLSSYVDDKPFACDKCFKQFNNKTHLEQHLKSHCDQKPFWCDECAARFKSNSHLKQHLVVHTNHRPFGCDKCDKSAGFKLESNLKKHLIRHADQRPFQCDKCSASFKIKSDLKRHLIRHTDQRPFCCDECAARKVKVI